MQFDLVGVAEVAEMLGVSRQRVHAIAQSQAAFPKPVADLSAGKIWLRRDIIAWAKSSGRGPQRRLTNSQNSTLRR